MINIAILGSTGSIGTQTLNICRRYPDLYKVVALSTYRSVDLLTTQIAEFNVPAVAVTGIEGTNLSNCTVYSTNIDIAREVDYDILVVALTGIHGLMPTIEAIKRGKRVALANKETLVSGGKLVKEALALNPTASLLPLDSEHSAIWQSISQNDVRDISRLILTASGGPFREYTLDQLAQVTLEDSLKHPNWNMGAKITVDCSTLMNKGLELMEAMWLFDMPEDKIDIVIHPESIIHSMVAYNDGAVIAQMANPSMELPIQYALTYPRREYAGLKSLDFSEIGSLHFFKPDYDRFPCLRLAREVAREGGILPAVLNSANTTAVGLYLEKKIGYLDIYRIVLDVVEHYHNVQDYTLTQVLEVDSQVSMQILADFN